MKLYSLIPVAALFAATLAGSNTHIATVAAGDLIKCADFSSVYYVGGNNKRYVFVNDRTFFTWYSDFSKVRTVTCGELASITIGGNVTYRPGVRMVKIQSDPRVYAVGRGGVLRHIDSEAVATAIFGSTWNKQIDDVSDSFFVNYTVGNSIQNASDYSKANELSSAPTINDDKRITEVITTVTDVSITDTGFSPTNITVQFGTRVRWTNASTVTHRPASNPHPAHTGLAGFDSLENLTPGTAYTYTFNERGTFGYHDHLNPSLTGTVTVQ